MKTLKNNLNKAMELLAEWLDGDILEKINIRTDKKARIGEVTQYVIIEGIDGVRASQRIWITGENSQKQAIFFAFADGTYWALQVNQYGQKLIKKSKKDLVEVLKSEGYCDDLISELLKTEINYTFEYMSLYDGYNYDYDDSLGSCMEGWGELFQPYEGMARFLMMFENGKPRARCIVWDEGVVYDAKLQAPLNKSFADKLYYQNGIYKKALIDYLINNNIKLLWRDLGLNYSYGELYINAPELLERRVIEGEDCCWMDTFNHYNTIDGKLYCYDWRRYGYEIDNIHLGINIDYVFLKTSGNYYRADDTENYVWSDYENSYIDRDCAIYISTRDDFVSDNNEDFIYIQRGTYEGETIHIDEAIFVRDMSAYYHIDDCIWSDIDNCYYSMGDSDYIDTIDGITYEDNPDYVYVGREDTYYPACDVVYSEYLCENLLANDAVYSEVLDDWVSHDENLEEIERNTRRI